MSTFDASAAPNGATAPATDMQALSAPATDTAIIPTARGFVVLTDGTVSVTTAAGNDVTFTATAGMTIICAISHVLSATTSNLLLYKK